MGSNSQIVNKGWGILKVLQKYNHIWLWKGGASTADHFFLRSRRIFKTVTKSESKTTKISSTSDMIGYTKG